MLVGANGQPSAYSTRPVIIDGQIAGWISIETDSSPIADMVNDYSGLSLTGETSVARPDRRRCPDHPAYAVQR